MSEGTPQQKLPRRRWRRILLRTLLGLLILVAAAPYLVSVAPFRNWALALGVRIAKLDGTFTARNASFGWFSDQRVEGVDLRTLDGRQLLTLDSVSIDRSLSTLLLHPRDFGTVRIEGLHGYLQVTQEGSNFGDALRRIIEEAAKQPPQDLQNAPWRNMSIKVVVADAGMTWELPSSQQPSTVGDMNLTVGLQSAATTASGQPELYIDQGTVIKDCEITVHIFRDLLRYAIPFGNSAKGKFSLQVDQGRIALDDFQQGKVSGQLILQSASIEPGPIIKTAADYLHVPANIELLKDHKIQVVVQQGRVYHQQDNLKFAFGYFSVSTRGSVGIKDQSLDMVLEFEAHLPESVMSQRPLLRALGSQPLSVIVKGTLNQPQFEFPALAGAMSLITEALENLKPEQALEEGKLNAVEQTLQQWIQENGGKASTVGAAAAEALPAAMDLLQQALEKRRQRKAAEQEQTATPPTQPPPADEPPKKRPLGRLRDLIRNELDKATEPETPNPAPAPSP